MSGVGFEGSGKKTCHRDEQQSESLSLVHAQTPCHSYSLQPAVHSIKSMVEKHSKTGTLVGSPSLFAVHLVKYLSDN